MKNSDAPSGLHRGCMPPSLEIWIGSPGAGNDLTKIPNMTVPLAAALKDFVDFDDIVTPEGAEQEYYNGLPQPYTIRNGPLPTMENRLSGVAVRRAGHVSPGGGAGVQRGGMYVPGGKRPSAQTEANVSKLITSLEL